MWKLSLKNNDDGALFFEDDIISIKKLAKYISKYV